MTFGLFPYFIGDLTIEFVDASIFGTDAIEDSFDLGPGDGAFLVESLLLEFP